MAVPARVSRRFVGTTKPVHLHQRTPGFHEPAGKQHALAKWGITVAIAITSGLVFESKCRASLGRSEEIERPSVWASKDAAGDSAIQDVQTALEVVEKILPPVQSAGVKVGWQVDLLDLVAGWRQPGIQQPGVKRSAQEPGVLTRPDAAVRVENAVRQRHARWADRPGQVPLVTACRPGWVRHSGGPGLAFSKFIG